MKRESREVLWAATGLVVVVGCVVLVLGGWRSAKNRVVDRLQGPAWAVKVPALVEAAPAAPAVPTHEVFHTNYVTEMITVWITNTVGVVYLKPHKEVTKPAVGLTTEGR